jgi:hypothetical protein
MSAPAPADTGQNPSLTLYAIGNLETEFVEGEAYQSPIYSGKNQSGEITGYETLYYDNRTYYLIEEGVSGVDLFTLSVSDPDSPTSSLSVAFPTGIGSNYNTNAAQYFEDGFKNVTGDLTLTSPFVYNDLGGLSNLYSVVLYATDGYNLSWPSTRLDFRITEAADVLRYGDAGNNSFDGFATGYTGIDGGDGVDTVSYDLESENASFTLSSSSSSSTYGSKSGGSSSSASSNSDLTITATTTVTSTYSGKSGEETSSSSSTDSETLSNIERLYFTDKAYALDLDGNAGIAAKVIIVTFGASDISTYMKAALSIVDSGTTLDELCDLVISGKYIEALAGGSDMSSFVEYVYGNVVGRELNAFEKAMMENISTGGSTKAELLKLAVQTDDVASQITTNSIDLVGVAGSSDGEKLVISFDA